MAFGFCMLGMDFSVSIFNVHKVKRKEKREKE
jgi:hypothetical protein